MLPLVQSANQLIFSKNITLHLISATFIIVLTWALAFVTRSFINARVHDDHRRYRWRKLANYLWVILTFVVLLFVFSEDLRQFGTLLGLLLAVLAIALRDLFVDVAGWLFILARRPFDVGDRIEIMEHRGDVIDVRLFSFSIVEIANWVEAEQSTGRIIHIPNNKVLSHSIANYSQGFNYIWHEISVYITLESDWQRAKAIVEEVLEQQTEKLSPAQEKEIRAAAQQYYIIFSKLTPIIYTRVEERGIKFTMRFLCHPQRRRGTEHAIWENLLCAFASCDAIQLAYPTMRLVQDEKARNSSSEI